MIDPETIATQPPIDSYQNLLDANASEPPLSPQAPELPLSANQLRVTDNLVQLLDILPVPIREALHQGNNLEGLIEIVMDLGRDAEARFADGRVVWLREGTAVTIEDIDYVTQRVGTFGKDNRAGIERTLHRISGIRNRQGRVIGLTCRVGRAVYGTIDIIHDIVESGKSILMLGRPGRGKTTKLREVARVLSDEFRKRVIIVDTSNEIAGDGDIPHPAIGHARRMQVNTPEDQHGVMIEAVENHMPEVVVIDEIGVEQEAFAARTIAERGVQLVGTAHGNSLENLLMNPTLSDLVGGIQAVTLSDEEAKKRGTQKTVLERKAPPTFDVIIEIMEVDKLAIHHDVTRTVDKMLRGGQPRPEIRIRNAQGQVEIVQKSDMDAGRPTERDRQASLFDSDTRGRGNFREEPAPRPYERAPEPSVPVSRITPAPAANGNGSGTPTLANGKPIPAVVHVFPYGVSRSRLERAIRTLRVSAIISKDLKDADAIIALKANYRKEPAKLQEGISRNIPTYVIKSNTYVQIETVLREIYRMPIELSEEDIAVQAAEEAIEEIVGDTTGGLNSLELAPQNSFLRRLQHQIAENYNMISESIGTEPNRTRQNQQAVTMSLFSHLNMKLLRWLDNINKPIPLDEISSFRCIDHASGKPIPAVVHVFPYGVSRSRLERAIRTLRVSAIISKDLKDADAIIALKVKYRKESARLPAKLQEGISRNIPTYVIKSNAYVQIEAVVREIYRLDSQW